MAGMPDSNPSAAAADRSETGGAGRKRILVVDDHRDAARILGLLLDSLGHEVRTASDGASAINEVAAFRPDVIFLDIGLPKVDGYEVARRVRALPAGKGLRLIALTGWGHAEAREQSRAAGFDDHLVKPVAAKALRELLSQ